MPARARPCACATEPRMSSRKSSASTSTLVFNRSMAASTAPGSLPPRAPVIVAVRYHSSEQPIEHAGLDGRKSGEKPAVVTHRLFTGADAQRVVGDAGGREAQHA